VSPAVLRGLSLPPGQWAWLMHGFDGQGCAHIRELGGQRTLLNMSGRRRFFVQPDGRWTGPPRTQVRQLERREEGGKWVLCVQSGLPGQKGLAT
jgi:hypothetical protein